MTRTRILLSATTILVLAFGAGWFLLTAKKSSPSATRQQPVDPPDDGVRAAVRLQLDSNGNHPWGCIDLHGKLVVTLQTPELAYMFPTLGQAGEFSEGLAAVSPSLIYFGYIDTMGKMVIPVQFYRAFAFTEHRALIGLDGTEDFRYGYIDPSGKMVIPAQYFAAHSFSEGLAAVKVRDGKHSKWGFIDLWGNMVIAPRFDDIMDFSEGLAVVTMDGKDGYIDHAGKIVIATRFYEALPFAGGRARVVLNKHSYTKYGYIDKTGKMVIPDTFDQAKDFSEGLAPVLLCPPAGCTIEAGAIPETNGRWGYIDTTGKMVIPPRFALAEGFSEDLAAVVDADDVWDGQYINKKGEVVIVTAFNHGSFSHNLASVGASGNAGFIDRTGKLIIPPRFYDAHAFRH